MTESPRTGTGTGAAEGVPDPAFEGNWVLDMVTGPWAIAIGVFVITCIRGIDALLHPHFWAEDGTVFWLENYTSGLQSLVTPYAGYLLITQRVFAWVLSLAPYLAHPILFSLGGAVVASWTAVTIATTVHSRPLGCLLGIALVMTRHDDGNVFMTLVNSQWIMACALPVIIVSPAPRSKVWRVNQLLFLGFAVLTGPFAVLLLPFWFLKLVPTPWTDERLGVWERCIGAIGLVGAMIQLGVLFFTGAPGALTFSMVHVPTLWLRVFSDCFGADRSIALATLTSAAVVMTLVFPRHRLLRIVSLYFAGVIMTLTALKFGAYPRQLLVDTVSGPRYFFIPAVMLAGVAVSLFFEEKHPRSRWLGIVLITLMLAGTFDGGFVRRDRERVFEQWSHAADRIGREHVTVKINPPYFPPMEIPPLQREGV